MANEESGCGLASALGHTERRENDARHAPAAALRTTVWRHSENTWALGQLLLSYALTNTEDIVYRQFENDDVHWDLQTLAHRTARAMAGSQRLSNLAHWRLYSNSSGQHSMAQGLIRTADGVRKEWASASEAAAVTVASAAVRCTRQRLNLVSTAATARYSLRWTPITKWAMWLEKNVIIYYEHYLTNSTDHFYVNI